MYFYTYLYIGRIGACWRIYFKLSHLPFQLRYPNITNFLDNSKYFWHFNTTLTQFLKRFNSKYFYFNLFGKLKKISYIRYVPMREQEQQTLTTKFKAL